MGGGIRGGGGLGIRGFFPLKLWEVSLPAVESIQEIPQAAVPKYQKSHTLGDEVGGQSVGLAVSVVIRVLCKSVVSVM